jgi:antitoxin (DNA-binding transcriptional repressor) of toxin-antitoxin stability system
MKAIGVKELKTRLSEYLRLVKGGETILVTERNEVVAEMRPARRQLCPADALEELLDALSDTGEISRSSLPKRGWGWRSRGIGLTPETVQALLDELRADR